MSSRTLVDLPWPRRTERLLLRPYRDDDLEAVWGFRSLPEVQRWITRAPADVADLASRFVASTDDPPLVVEVDGVVVGDAMVRVGDSWAQAEVAAAAERAEVELGWVLAPSHQGRGLGQELVRELLALSFDGLGVRRVTAACFTDNAPSWRVMERVGMRRESHSVRDGLHRDLGWLDAYTYALLEEEWRAQHA